MEAQGCKKIHALRFFSFYCCADILISSIKDTYIENDRKRKQSVKKIVSLHKLQVMS